MICFRLRLTSVSRYFFARFDLMKWKDYGIMVKYKKRKAHEEMLKCLR